MRQPEAAFRAFLAGLLDNPMQQGQPFCGLVLHLCKTHGLTMTCGVLDVHGTMMHEHPKK